jgi:hypothetical protein
MNEPTSLPVIEQFTSLIAQAVANLSLSAVVIEAEIPDAEDAAKGQVVGRVFGEVRALLDQFDGEMFPPQLTADYLDGDGSECVSYWDEATDDDLLRIAAHAIVSAALLRQECDSRIRTAVTALALHDASTQPNGEFEKVTAEAAS